MMEEVVDSGDQVFDASETPSANCLLGDEPEPTFDLIEPRRVGGSVVDLEAGPLCQPESYPGMLVGVVVVNDQMNIKAFRYGLIDALEELKNFLMTLACLALRQDSARGDVEGGKPRRLRPDTLPLDFSFVISLACSIVRFLTGPLLCRPLLNGRLVHDQHLFALLLASASADEKLAIVGSDQQEPKTNPGVLEHLVAEIGSLVYRQR